MLLEAVSMLRHRRSLWLLAVVPVTFTIAAFAVAIGLVSAASSEIWALTSAWLPWPEALQPWHWIWVGPLRALSWLGGWLLFLLAAVAALLVSLFAANLLAAPFLDRLSERVEEELDPIALAASAQARSGLALEALRSVAREGQRLLFFLFCWGVIWLVLLIVPGGPALAPLAIGFLTVFFLPLDFASYSLDRRSVPFALRRRWLRRHWTTMVGFGAGAFAIGMVPGLNLLLMPVLVVAGTLLVLRNPPAPTPSIADGAAHETPNA